LNSASADGHNVCVMRCVIPAVLVLSPRASIALRLASMRTPQKALVLSVDEKSQIQALDRTQPVLPLRPGIPGTTTLFAAFNGLSGEGLGHGLPRHRHQGFLRFLEPIERSAPRRGLPGRTWWNVSPRGSPTSASGLPVLV